VNHSHVHEFGDELDVLLVTVSLDEKAVRLRLLRAEFNDSRESSL